MGRRTRVGDWRRARKSRGLDASTTPVPRSLGVQMRRARNITLGFAALSAVYLYTFPSAALPYLIIVLGHVAAGFVLATLLILSRPRSPGWIVTAAGALSGIA